MSAASLLSELQSRAESGSDAGVEEVLAACAPQLLQLEQQAATGVALEAEQRALADWVAHYAAAHEQPSKAVASLALASPSSPSPAPLLFYLLSRAPLRGLPLEFVSALYNDPQTDRDHHWLNDPAALVEQIRQKVTHIREDNARVETQYARTKNIGQTHA